LADVVYKPLSSFICSFMNSSRLYPQDRAMTLKLLASYTADLLKPNHSPAQPWSLHQGDESIPFPISHLIHTFLWSILYLFAQSYAMSSESPSGIHRWPQSYKQLWQGSEVWLEMLGISNRTWSISVW